MRVIYRKEQSIVYMDQNYILEGCQQFNNEAVQLA